VTTRLELREAVLANTSREDRVEYINTSLNRGLNYISRAHLFRSLREEFSITFTEGTTEVDLPERFQHFEGARIFKGDTGGWVFQVRPKGAVLHRYPRLTTPARPLMGYVDYEDQKLKFVPEADVDYEGTLSVYRFPPFLVTDSSELHDPQWEQALIAFASYQVFMSIESFQSASVWSGEFERELRSLIKNDNRMGGVEVRANPGLAPGSEVVSSLEPWTDPFAKG
jgi:hypothetical protein